MNFLEFALRMFFTVLSGAAYGRGGESDLVLWRRWGCAPLLLVMGIIIFMSPSGWLEWLLVFTVYISYGLITSSMFYGHNFHKEKAGLKWIARIIQGLMLAQVGLPLVIYNGAWALYFLQMIFAVATCSFLGVLNPFDQFDENYEGFEECMIGTASTLFVLFYF